MPALTINGWTAPVAFGTRSRIDEIGVAERAEDGTLGLDRTALKDSLDLSTSWLRREEAAALRGLILGRGHRFAFENNGSIVGDIANALYSSRKLAPTTSTGAVLRVSEVIAESTSSEFDGDKFGLCALAAEAAATNLLSSNVATGAETDTTGFTAIAGGILAKDVAVYRQGAASLKVTYAADGDGVKTTAVSVSATTKYVGSVYLRANSGTPDVRVFLRDAVNATNGTIKTVRLSATVWKRIEVAHTMGAGAPTAELHILKDGAGTNSFYCDQLQVQVAPSAAGTYATTWADGTKAATELKYYMGGFRRHDDLTIMFWTRGPANSNADSGYFFLLGNSTDHLRFEVNGDPIVTAKVGGTDQSALTASSSALTAAGAWVHVAVVLRRNPQTGSHKLELYWNGVIDATTADPASLPNLAGTATFPHLWVGSNSSGATHLNGLVDELVVVPWGMTGAQITAWYNAAFSDLPDLNVAGDVVNSAVTMRGEDVASEAIHAYNAGTLEVHSRESFRLREA